MNLQQTIAYETPCRRAADTVDPRYFWRHRPFSVGLTVNR